MNRRIDILIAKKLSNELTTEELAELKKILASSNEAVDQLSFMEEIWNRPYEGKANEHSMEPRWKKLQSRLEIPSAPSGMNDNKVGRTKLIMVLIAVAAIVMLLLFFVSRQIQDHTPQHVFLIPRASSITKLPSGQYILDQINMSMNIFT